MVMHISKTIRKRTFTQVEVFMLHYYGYNDHASFNLTRLVLNSYFSWLFYASETIRKQKSNSLPSYSVCDEHFS